MTEHKHHFNNKTVILVEDDVDCLNQVKTHLEAEGFVVTTAETQSAAEDLINEKAFDVAIIDLMLEYKDSGFILCYKFKKKNPKAPAIIITGVSAQAGIHFDMSSEESRDWIKADAILDKEIRFEQLDRELGRLLEG